MHLIAWGIFFTAAVMEVTGDALIRKGLRGAGGWLIAVGFLILGGYGIVVNTVRWDFSKLLGVYVCMFALVSILTGRFLFREVVPLSTWIGLAIIIAGGMVIQFGTR
jgi:small multidrug resistance family-3 protein